MRELDFSESNSFFLGKDQGDLIRGENELRLDSGFRGTASSISIISNPGAAN